MSTTGTAPGGLCGEVEERLAEVLEGTARASLYEHIAGCDACRDLRHDAARAAEMLADAGADFRPADGFAEALIHRLDATRAGERAPGGAAAQAPDEARTGSSVTDVHTAGSAADARTAGSAADAHTAGPATLAHTAGSATDTPTAGPAADVHTSGSAANARTAGSAADARTAGPATHVPTAGPATLAHTAGPATDTPTSGPAADARTAGSAADARTAGPTADARTAGASRTAPAPRRALRAVPWRRAVFAAVGAAAVAAGALALRSGAEDPASPQATTGSPWSGKIAAVSRASADKTGGLVACDAAGACAPLAPGAEVPEATTLRTDARTRAHVALADGTRLALDRASRVWIGAGSERRARVEAGAVVLDVASIQGAAPARIDVPHGQVEVLGTKLAITASEERSFVEVARGLVRVTGERGAPVEVRAGEEAALLQGAAPDVAVATSPSDALSWSDRDEDGADAPLLRGLGELRARKPGATQEKERAVRLAKHAVKVRIVDVVARTEIDETFANDTDEELEGIFRFPLPPGAQIERLALEVDGELVEGAFVDRDRGAAIWRGVLQNAAPKAPKPREEIIWVPGPWRDPALLEWQRGGRFELRIFPIPKRGSRRVVLTYTQLVDHAGGVRRFTYPLAHDDSGTTKIGDFSLDVQVLGHDKAFGVTTRGYELATAPADGAADRRTLQARGFTPAGDLTVEYALPDRDRPVTAWAYRADPAAQPRSEEPKAAAAKRGAPRSAEQEAALAAARAIVNDTSPYVAIAIRPELPRWQEARSRRHVLVVDASRSMIGERFARATRLAASIVREMDRRDDVVVLACDTLCRAADERGGAARPMAPGATSAAEVERFLGGIEPDGGSDLAAAMIAARAAAGSLDGRELRIVYLGDGTPSVGPTRPAHLEAAVRGALPADSAAVIAVALGSDADATSLQALARAGGGVMVPYVPGQTVASAAQAVLGAAYGLVLRDPELELPPGLADVAPARLDPIRAGGEVLVVARMRSGAEVDGAIRLRGRVSGERFEQTYPIHIVATTSAGNAFVPRLYAAAKIAELERAGGEAQKPAIIELSKRFSVASRFTSLLVLESEAMFKAFGLDRGGVAPEFTGEQEAERLSARAEGEAPDDAAAEADDLSGLLDADAASAMPAAPKRSAGRAEDGLGMTGTGLGGGGRSLGPQPAPAAAPTFAAPPAAEPASKPSVACPPGDPRCSAPEGVARQLEKKKETLPDRWRRRMVPMRKVFDRNVRFDPTGTLAQQDEAKVVAAEAALAAAPDSRDKTMSLYALYATTGRLGEAAELTARWSGRDALDPEALIARADLAARGGERDRAARILGGLADVRPGDRAIQARLAELWDAAGRPAFACQHRVALADLAPGDAKLVAAAVQCASAHGMTELATQLRLDATGAARSQLDRLLAQPAAPAAARLAGDVQLSAEWTGDADLDLALIDAQGRRISWMGTTLRSVGVSSRDATSTRAESLAVKGLPRGTYLVELTRASSGAEARPSSGAGSAADVVRGELTLRLAGQTRKVPFTLAGARLTLGTVRVFFTSRLVPIDASQESGRPWRP